MLHVYYSWLHGCCTCTDTGITSIQQMFLLEVSEKNLICFSKQLNTCKIQDLVKPRRHFFIWKNSLISDFVLSKSWPVKLHLHLLIINNFYEILNRFCPQYIIICKLWFCDQFYLLLRCRITIIHPMTSIDKKGWPGLISWNWLEHENIVECYCKSIYREYDFG